MRGLVKRLMLFLIGCYQVSISPLLGDCCRYRPTCSQYAKEAIERHGAFKGLCLAVWRVLRCNPFSKGGYDPVPASFSLIKRRERRG